MTLRNTSSESLRQGSSTSSTRGGKGEVAHRVTIDREGDFILTLSVRESGAAADPPKMEMPRGVKIRHGIRGDSRENQGGKRKRRGDTMYWGGKRQSEVQ